MRTNYYSNLGKIKNAQYDVCLILGDISNNDIIEILKLVPYEKIYGLFGNHDGLDRFEESEEILKNGTRVFGKYKVDVIKI